MTKNPLASLLGPYKNKIPREFRESVQVLIYDFGQAVKRWHKTEETGLFLGVPYVDVIQDKDKQRQKLSNKELKLLKFLRQVLKIKQTGEDESSPIKEWQGKLIKRQYKTASPKIVYIELVNSENNNPVLSRLLYKP